jgi:hypothetical protein
LDKQSTAQGIRDDLAIGNQPPQALADYEDARKDRDRYRTFAAIGLGAGAVLGVTGLLLYTLDRPTPPVREAKDDGGPKPDAKPQLEMRATPLLGPGLWGVGASVVF